MSDFEDNSHLIIDEENAEASGTGAVDRLKEVLWQNWGQVQQKYNEMVEEEKSDILEHFNSAYENIGDKLFGNEAELAAVLEYVTGLNEERKR